MSSIRYPSLDEFWPAKRARHFVQALGFPATKYVENMAVLAERAGVHPAQMCMVNPLTFAERNLPDGSGDALDLLGQRTYVQMAYKRKHSVPWAYEKGWSIPPFLSSDPTHEALRKAHEDSLEEIETMRKHEVALCATYPAMGGIESEEWQATMATSYPSLSEYQSIIIQDWFAAYFALRAYEDASIMLPGTRVTLAAN